jgi:hypothetical protein
VPKAPARKGSKAKPKAAPRKAKVAAKAAAKPRAALPAPVAAPVIVPQPARSPARLGEEMVQVQAKLSREPLSLIVARTDIVAGGVRIKALAPSVVRVARGQVVHVKHAYRLQEHSPEREEYRFLLKSNLAGHSPPPSLARHGDQWGVPEDINGYVQHEHKLTQPGTYALEFEVGAEYCVMGWSDTAVKALDRKDLKGRIDVVVS